MFKRSLFSLLAAASLVGGAHAASTGSFTNGSFETGNTTGWSLSTIYRANILNPNLDSTDFTGKSLMSGHAAVVSSGLDPYLGSKMANVVYGGSYALRIEDTTYGGYSTLASQTVTNYTDPTIFFAWMAVLESAHGVSDAATMLIELIDKTTNTTLIKRTYNATTSSAGAVFSFDNASDLYYTPTWQIEQLSIDASLQGHTFELNVLAADCEPTGHLGYVYLDGFGAAPPTQGPVTPPPAPTGVPEPGSLALAGVALLGLMATRRRRA